MVWLIALSRLNEYMDDGGIGKAMDIFRDAREERGGLLTGPET